MIAADTASIQALATRLKFACDPNNRFAGPVHAARKSDCYAGGIVGLSLEW